MTTAPRSPALERSPPPAADPSRLGAAVALWGRRHRALLLVLACYAAAAVVVPTLAPVATTDDWAYARSAQILLDEGRLVVFPVVAATAVFPIVWGALFGLLFGPELGVFRLSTVAMVGGGGIALYGLCRQLGVDRGRSALGAAAYLFNPLVFVLGFTFMTDPFFASLLILAALGYVRGLRPGRLDHRAILLGSAAAALAFLTRQQGALIPPAVVAALILLGRLRWDRTGVRLLLAAAGLPTLTIAAYGLWLRFFNRVPQVQESFLRDALAEGWSGTWWLVQRLAVVELAYLGFFALPLVAAVLPSVRRLVREVPRRGWLIFALWAAILVAGTAWFWTEGRRMPFVGQFFGSGGLGAPDVLGARPRLLDGAILDALTVACVVGSLVAALVAARAAGIAASPARSRAGLLSAILVGQVAGVLPPSYHYIGRTAGTLDRYLLPLVPLALALGLWALRGVRPTPPLGWLVVAAFACFAVAGTRDYIVYLQAVWSLAREANAAGVPNTKLDAGSAWDGYHLYEYGLANDITKARSPRGSPWWVYFYAKATDSSYVVSAAPRRGYAAVLRRDYDSWLETEPTPLFLLRRTDAPWPPAAGEAPRPVPPIGWRVRDTLPDPPGAEPR